MVFDAEAVARIFEAKRRPSDNPLIGTFRRLFSDREACPNSITGSAERLIEAFFPGPLTVVLRKSREVPGHRDCRTRTRSVSGCSGYDLAYRSLNAWWCARCRPVR
ncbi:MAG: Sua5/YciO/YrdC/YwlC family protein [Chloracidobacterium sp.]|nr:Sua5/YciO/YrdC/YwlC family protein [Chloracidobacterium sp.]